MLQDSLAQAAQYTALHPLFSEAFAWLSANRACADGRYAIRGEDLFVIVETGSTCDPAVRRFEAHRTYIDIQVNLAGGEIMEWLPVTGLDIADDFQPDGDIAFFKPPSTVPSKLHVQPDHFTVFWPSDAHKPICNPPTGATSYRKMVFKVRAGVTVAL